MKLEKTKKDLEFSVFCPYLKRTVILKRKTWQYYIIPKHPEVRNCTKLIEQILSKDATDIFKCRKTRDNNELMILKKNPVQLHPLYDYIKIGLKLIGDKEAIVATAHGQNNLPKEGVEEIK